MFLLVLYNDNSCIVGKNSIKESVICIFESMNADSQTALSFLIVEIPFLRGLAMSSKIHLRNYSLLCDLLMNAMYKKAKFLSLVLLLFTAGVLQAQSGDADNDGIPDDFECGCPFGAVVNGSFEYPKFDLESYNFYSDFAVPGWKTTASDKTIELWSSGFNGANSADGNQFAELNANEEAALYQKLCLRPGMVVNWSVQHRGRFGTDVAVVKIGASIASASVVETMADGLVWGQYSGSYTVPAGQTETFFIFEAVSSTVTNSTGNFIDDVRITVTSSPPCTLDTDGDGVIDPQDLDSDNDGILDEVECGVRICPGGVIQNGGFELPVIPPAATSGQSQINVPGWKTTATDKVIEVWSTGAQSTLSAEGNQFVELNANQASTLFQSLCLNEGSEVEWSVKHKGRIGTDVAVVKIGADLASATIQDSLIDGKLTWGAYSGTYTVPPGQKQTVFAFQAISSSIGDASFGNLLDDVRVTLVSGPENVCLDADEDWIPNFMELDSDDDGCPDAVEAYNNPAAVGTDGNAYYGNGNPPAVDSKGKVTAASYNVTVGRSNQQTYPTTIVTQPETTDMYTSSTASFYAETNEGDSTVYEWQLSTDEGVNWTPVTDSDFYEGFETNTLTVNKGTPEMDGNAYRLKITQTSRICTELYSDTVFLYTCTMAVTAGKISDQTCIPLPGEPSNGKAYAFAQGGTPPYSYTWNTIPERTTDTIDQLEPGFYLVTVTDANGCTWTNVGVAYDQNFDSYTPGRLTEVPPGSTVPKQESDAANWYTEVDGNSAFFIAPQFVGLPPGESALWFSDSPGTGLEKLFISDPITVQPNVAHVFSAKVRKATTNPPIFTAFYSIDNGMTWNTIGSVDPSNFNTWETAKYIFTPTTNTIKIRIGSTTTGAGGNDGGLDFVSLREVEEGIAIDTGTVPCCRNPSMAGSISLDQYICLNMQPTKLKSIAGASGETGVLQYKWQSSVKEDNSDWTDIPGATNVDYQPPVLNQTTWYRRVVKVDCEETWEDAPVSDTVKITVVPDTDRYLIIESLVQPTCNPPQGCTLTIKGLPMATWTMEQTGPVNTTLTGTGNPLVLEDLPDGVYKFRTADANGCIESPPFGVIVVTY
jgi:hypothetical protein